MNTPARNVSFSSFYNEVWSIYESMTDQAKRAFRDEVAKYYKQDNEPPEGWRDRITVTIGSSETKINWNSVSYLEDLKQSKGNIKRIIAFYYYLHSLTHDLSFAAAVDELVFVEEPAGRRAYEKSHDRAVFQPAPIVIPPSDTTWKSSLHHWELSCQPNKPMNLRLASLAIEATQSSNTNEPLALIACVHIMPAYEVESGIELRFKSVDIVIECDAERYSSHVRYLDPSQWSTSCQNAKFCQSGTSTAPYLTLLDEDGGGLNGTYASDTLLLLQPNQRASQFDAVLGVRVIETNAVFPEDMKLSSRMKTEIIKRMLSKAILPEPSETGHIPLHKIKYDICAVERATR